MGWSTGLEPATTGTTNQGSTIELQPPYVCTAFSLCVEKAYTDILLLARKNYHTDVFFSFSIFSFFAKKGVNNANDCLNCATGHWP